MATELLKRVEHVPERLLNLIADRSEGVPYFAEEIVNWFLDHGILDRSGDPWRFVSTQFESSPFPSTLQHLLQTRLLSLRKSQREALQYGSIFGRSFWEGGLHALGTSLGSVRWEILQERGFVEIQQASSFEGNREWRFQHNLMREVVYESILKRQRPDLHRAVADWLEVQSRRTNRLDEWARRIGEHAERAGDMNVAADWYLRAGRRAKAQGAPPEALEFFERTLNLLSEDDHELRWQVLLERSEMLGILSKPELRKKTDNMLLEMAVESGNSSWIAEAYYRQGSFFESTGDPHAALEALEVALGASRSAQEHTLEASILSLMVLCHARLGSLNTANELAE